MQKQNAKKHIKSKEKRPKAIDSSHNACRYGYPFFLSPSDDDAMLEIPNPTPSVHQTPGYCCCWSETLPSLQHPRAQHAGSPGQQLVQQLNSAQQESNMPEALLGSYRTS